MKRLKLIDVMPSSIKNDKKVQALCEVLDPYLDVMWDEIDKISIYKNIDTLDDEFLDHLAYQFHVDYYNTNFPIEKKRTAIKNSIAWHRHKGTPWAVEDLLSKMFSETWLSEWFEYGGEPYYFRIYTKDNIMQPGLFEDFMQALWEIKNTRSWLEAIVFIRPLDVNVALYPQFIWNKTLLPHRGGDIVANQSIYIGMAAPIRQSNLRYYSVVNLFRNGSGELKQFTTAAGNSVKWRRANE